MKEENDVEDLRKMIESVNTAKKSKIEKDATLQQMYPKTYMFSKVTDLVKEKQGLSDFEIYGGVSEIFGNETT